MPFHFFSLSVAIFCFTLFDGGALSTEQIKLAVLFPEITKTNSYPKIYNNKGVVRVMSKHTGLF